MNEKVIQNLLSLRDSIRGLRKIEFVAAYSGGVMKIGFNAETVSIDMAKGYMAQCGVNDCRAELEWKLGVVLVTITPDHNGPQKKGVK